MLRVFLTIAVPLALPTVLYLVWLRAIRRLSPDGTILAVLPWIPLAVAGVVLLALVLFLVNVRFGAPQQGTYVPPRWLNGRMVPGHVDPKPVP